VTTSSCGGNFDNAFGLEGRASPTAGGHWRLYYSTLWSSTALSWASAIHVKKQSTGAARNNGGANFVDVYPMLQFLILET
jgi:hypothetical protein